MAWGILDFGFDSIFSTWDGFTGADDPREMFLRKKIKDTFSSKDCFVLDANLKELKDSLAYLKAEKLNGYRMNLPNKPNFIEKSYNDFNNYIQKEAKAFYRNNTQINSYYAEKMGNDLIPSAILFLENSSTLSDCRNVIEQKRLEESAGLISKQSAIQESNVLPENYKEQYLYIGLGSVVLLVSLYLISKKIK